MPENFRERADLTKIIKSILDSYPLGNGILRELLQNSDDAGATQQTFILDMRTHPSGSVVDQDLVECQGPALLAVNDTLFSESDWKAISTLHSSSKTADESKIGKFGIGVRACYHITDNPHFLSGRKLAIFDPHERFSAGREGGVRIDVPTEGAAYPDQLAAFDESLHPDAVGNFPGTVVRLPLRTANQAMKSTIKPTVVDLSLIETLFEEFVEKELSVVMLFLKHIRHISLKVISPDGRERFVGSAEIPDLSIADKRTFSRNTGARQETFKCTINVISSNGVSTSQVWRIYHAVRSTEETSAILTGGLGYNVGSKLSDDKLFSHVALAFPVDPAAADFKGRLFTLLPLPIHTYFPVHMHGILALTQDRQSLRNIEETGTGADSRERLLVTWNRTIFEEFLPTTWGNLLKILVENHEVADIWTAWPALEHATNNGSGYWNQILPHLMQRVLELNIPVFPTFPNAKSHVSLSSAFIASEQDDIDVLRALSKVGLHIVKLTDDLQKALPFAANNRLLDPLRVRAALTGRISALASIPDADKDRILRYLVVAPGTVANVVGLPLVPLTRGGRTLLLSTEKYVLATQQEGEIFGDSNCNGELVSLSRMPPDVASVFLASQMNNVVRLKNNHVREYINILFGGFDPAKDEISGNNLSNVAWLVQFWKWLAESTWEDKDGLLQLVSRFHLLPTAQGTLRKLESRVPLPLIGAVGHRTMAAWEILTVHFLHSDVVPYTTAFSRFTVAGNDIQFLLGSIQAHSIPNLNSSAALVIQEHLVQSLGSRGTSVRLSAMDRRNFLQLPIFPIRSAIPTPKGGKKLSRRDVGAASGTLVFMRVDDSCPVPITPSGTTFFDVTHKSGVLGTIIDAAGTKGALNELGVLAIAIDQLAAQPRPILDALLSRIIPRLSDLLDAYPAAKNKLQHVPFVSVKGSTDYISPAEVIDPRSDLAVLYEGEANKLPTGRWGQDPSLSLLTSHGFFQRELTAAIVAERVQYLTSNWPKEEYRRIFVKAQAFLRLLDQSWSSIQTSVVAHSLTGPWLPVRADAVLAAPAACRDAAEKRYLFDLVLSVVDGRVENTALRRLLGWDGVSNGVLREQLQCALTHSKNRAARLHALIMEYAKRLSTLSFQDLEDVKATVSNQPWIPVNSTEIVRTKHALLSPTTGTLHGPFRTVPHLFLEAANRQGYIFLEKIGCSASPSIDTLLTEFEALIARSADSEVVSEAIDMLKNIAVSPGLSEDDRARIFVPGSDGLLHPIANVYKVDSTSDFRPEMGLPVHPDVSIVLAFRLGVQFLSALELDDDDNDDDGLQMGEDFTTRVEGVLKDHDVRYALNEFMANAIDAKATKFSVLLDERTFESSKVLGPGLSDLQRRPALFLYNDAAFSEADFRGLRQVGKGGKASNPDSIGRYGLGALSLFHFTDVVQIVSNRHLLILDPSGTHLPPRRGRPRTSVLKDLSNVARRYPDQLSAFDSLGGFSKTMSSYSGTLFRLSLRDAASPLSSTVLGVPDCLNLINGPYFSLARDATYFTSLQHISAAQQPPMGSRSPLWEIIADRVPLEDHGIVSVKASGRDRLASSQRWLVSKSATPFSDVPPEHTGVFGEMRLHESKIGLVVQVALLLDDKLEKESEEGTTVPTDYSLFSTLRLPVQTTLPAHISAQFAISSDRRHIRFEPPDISGNRIPQAGFNGWILDTLVPRLYISTIHHAAIANLRSYNKPRRTFGWWPGSNRADDDPISRVVVQAFYDMIPKSAVPICNTVTGQLVSPTDAVFAADQTPTLVQAVLRRLRTPRFAELPFAIRRLVTATAGRRDSLQFVDPVFVQEVLETQTTTFHDLYTKKHRDISIPTIDAVLQFLLKGGVTPSNLPLLVAADGTLTRGNSQQRTLYVCRETIPDIFRASNFLDGTIERETQDLLIQNSTMNVKLFDADGVLSLLKEQVSPTPRCVHPPELQQWITRFWETYDRLPSLSSPTSLDPLPLIPTANGEHISLEYCRRDDVITEPIGRPALVSAMQRMYLIFCQIPAPLRSSFDKPFDLDSYLKAIKFKSYPFDSLSADETREIGSWIRSTLYSCADSDSRNILKGLPIWEARRDAGTVLLSARDVKMLPRLADQLDLEIFDGYTISGTALAKFNQDLHVVRSWHPSIPSLTSEGLAKLLYFPDLLEVSRIPSYATVLTSFLNLGGAGTIPVPDGNLRLREPGSLYDHSVEMFSLALQSRERTVFLHPNFRAFHQLLRGKNLHFVVDWESFFLCATTVDEDLTARFLPEDVVVPRAEVVYRFFNSDLPRIVMANARRWSQLDGLRFILRDPVRSPSASYTTDAYCENLPQIVAPSQILQRKYEQIAWTQRALFQEEPLADLIGLNKSLGVPTAAQVVNHLTILAQRVAPEHPGNRSLLEQLSATYGWLNENKEAAGPHLLRATGVLFLNVDDPSSEAWEWRSAEQLLFDVEYDWPETNTFRVRQFLQDYRPLLLAAGASIEHAVDYKPRSTATDGNALREAFDTMRRAGQLTDVVLEPVSEPTGGNVDELRAHSTFLAAAIPHVRDGLLGWRESTSGVYPFPGTYFGARAVLDFIYTGKIEPNPQETGDGHMNLLQNLLELLGDADEWNMPELKDEVGRLVKEWRLLSRDTYRMIVQSAEQYQATALLDYCREWGNKNPAAVRRSAEDAEEDGDDSDG